MTSPAGVTATALAESESGPVRAQVGTVVETLAEGVFEVEFSDDEGRSYATLPLRGEQLMVLHHELLST